MTPYGYACALREADGVVSRPLTCAFAGSTCTDVSSIGISTNKTIQLVVEVLGMAFSAIQACHWPYGSVSARLVWRFLV